jgi:hypothetical protein
MAIVAAAAALPTLGGFLGQMLGSIVLATALTTLQNPLVQVGNQLFSILPADTLSLIKLRFREEIDEDYYFGEMAKQGFGTRQANDFLTAALFFPSPQDLVNWQAKEVFEEGAVIKYGLDAEFDAIDLTSFGKAGVSIEQAKNFWRAHWEHPPFGQVIQMMHRDILVAVTDRENIAPGSPEWVALREDAKQELFEWYKLVEIPQHWRDKLTKLSDTLITRVDLRRMYDMRVIDDARLLRGNLDLGLTLEDAEALTLWTKVDNAFSDLVSRFSNGWVSRDEVLAELVATGMPEDRAIELMETRIDNLAKPRRIATERDLTKSEIIKGVKREIIGPDTAVILLQEMGFDAPEAEFILAINIESEGSPEDETELRSLVQGWRQAIGLTSQAIPPNIIRARKAARKAKEAFEAAKEAKAKDDVLGPLSELANRLDLSFRKAANEAGLLDELLAQT